MPDNTFQSYQILESLPVYGPMYTPVSWREEPSFSEGYVVRFFRDDKTEWVANFFPGWTEFCVVIEMKNSKNLLVVAFGAAYIMNPNEETPLGRFGVGFHGYAEHVDGRIVLVDQTDLTIVEPGGKYWTTKRISIDGLKNLEINGDIVSGLCYSLESGNWQHFSYDIENKILIGGSYDWDEV